MARTVEEYFYMSRKSETRFTAGILKKDQNWQKNTLKKFFFSYLTIKYKGKGNNNKNALVQSKKYETSMILILFRGYISVKQF